MEYYSAIKTEFLIHVLTWMNFENTVLSEKSHIPKDKYCMIPHNWNRQIHRHRK